MLKHFHQHKWLILTTIAASLMLSAIGSVFAYNDVLFDRLSMTASVFFGFSLCLFLSLFVMEKIRDICNP
ncbi:hypothetical protein I2F27_10895 [Acinetobacter sp. B5B]|uniref:hypothetical protein n=1 Tax=Acinetobacter baretiae TaxID=2605383 RepID=UPI0018C30E36|nr:hypothetical protein [Acinetobacter baretiae]MBF7683824.1 hypothetical protein [Acinetobacter baretiae]MBF7686102.1 hypothetical protein [Acinetobacter baretiae]